MKRLHFCLLIPLTFIAKTSIAQNATTTVPLTTKILSASGHERDGPQGLSFSVGALNHVIFLAEDQRFPESDTFKDTISVASLLSDAISPYSEDNDEAASLSVYPNPFVDRITLNIRDFTNDRNENFQYQLVDLLGNTLKTQKVKRSIETISLDTSDTGLFVLLLFKNGIEIKSFKLIKSNP